MRKSKIRQKLPCLVNTAEGAKEGESKKRQRSVAAHPSLAIIIWPVQFAAPYGTSCQNCSLLCQYLYLIGTVRVRIAIFSTNKDEKLSRVDKVWYKRIDNLT
jgi:hypothetical protein